ncbi:delta-aminolevulinic acid dehydratase [Halieaceae bacterium IMCC14734]|uniref:Delta-aminolevulinic acid dehydratase n=1 Tax=Candidatus Litorirhabdus singularis TaxID=2518993 RepID=A0ABT3TLX9_9GAMM|nr:delta-aminolevulinic acid dehydratase [Candidatus Litorirhabdus singularis]MCX2983328.1 delta-aminolevulinic acid dehydratase [Candidatus Litorirhabdus singularis]
MTPRHLLWLCLLGSASAAQAECECIWQGPFTRVQQHTDLVVTGQVIASQGNSIDIEHSETWRGTNYQPTIRVWLNSGELCRPEVEQFPLESSWVMALQRIDEQVPGGFNPSTPNISYGRVGDYTLSSCGGYWLSLHGEVVTGNLASGTRWEHNPKMSPVLSELVAAFVAGEIDADALKQASELDPELQRLQLDTRSFLRQQR